MCLRVVVTWPSAVGSSQRLSGLFSFSLARRGTCDGGIGSILELMAAISRSSPSCSSPRRVTIGLNLSKFEEPACISNLRGLHGAFSSWLADHENVWPQLPPDASVDSGSIGTVLEHEFWIKTFEPYGLTQKNWTCPTFRRLVKLKQTNLSNARIHYLPTLFDEVPGRAYRSPFFLWLMEIATGMVAGTC